MSEMTDEQRYDFLLDLDDAGVTVTKREADFLDNILTRTIRSFTEKQRDVIDKMYDKYTGRGVT